MTEKTLQILLIRFVKTITTYDFENPVEESLRLLKKPGDALFTMDNHSDTATISYAKKFLQGNAPVVLICHFEQDTPSLGSALSVLNFALKTKATLYSNQDTMPIKVFFKKLNGKKYLEVSDLKKWIFTD